MRNLVYSVKPDTRNILISLPSLISIYTDCYLVTAMSLTVHLPFTTTSVFALHPIQTGLICHEVKGVPREFYVKCVVPGLHQS